jgi:NADH:ubiquinone oxidoreductase subunit F (NADH-binding)/(2Fe-2S) ferredoxin/NAD-dependent dihydropyrimidine dehydrogenase PreA subunit
MDRHMKLNSIQDLEALREQISKAYDPQRKRIRICMTGCLAHGADKVRDALVSELRNQHCQEVELVETGCFGFCAKAPVVAIDPEDIFYQQVQPEDATEIISQTIMKGNIVDRLTYLDTATKKRFPYRRDIPFYKKQVKHVLSRCGRIDPKNVDHYLLHDGYKALAKVLTSLSAEDVIDMVKKSGLRGRGGGGFLTGLKWEFCRQAHGNPKYIICNADEGDPGAFMDRGLLEGDPHTVLEGMLIGAYAIGAEYGYVYVRAEYPLAIKHLKIALADMESLGLLGDHILGSDFSFHLQIKEGAGAFVCGEETALMASIEGKRGMPRPRPPFPANKGLWGKPSNINNVETFGNVPIIILHGSAEYAKLGTEKSKGTKIFALAGRINNTGLVEIPVGTLLRDIIFDIGGGVTKGRKFKAVQLGGPSGGCIPGDYLDVPIDYDSLISLGAIMGSGGMVVMDSANCMIDVARFFLEFIQNESCGKCVPCRIGTKRMLEIVTRITEGKGQESDLELLKELAEGIKATSLCALGQTAPNPVLSTIRYFLDEYRAHILEKRCPAHVCSALVKFEIAKDLCKKCGVCKKVCPAGAINWEPKSAAVINKDLCIQCRTCIENCPAQAIE